MQKSGVGKLLLVLLSLLLSYTFTKAQSLSPDAELSLLTCGQGEELYSTFGHSAIRVKDTVQQLDIVFNYGLFDFSDPNFYTNFVRGKLNYMLGIQNYSGFIKEYINDDRWVYEQVLNLTHDQKTVLLGFLIHNNQPENRFYLYDFLFDNCSSRIRDILTRLFPGEVVFSHRYQDITGEPTFRDLLHSYLNESPWTKLGIDILLGKRVDRIAKPEEYMFLPDYLLEAFANATINNEPLVKESHYLYRSETQVSSSKPLFVPLLIFIILLVLVVAAYIMRLPLKWFDISIFFVIGLLGILLIFMWFGTDHYVTKYNFNLLWAIPSHAVVCFFLLKHQRPRWVLWYFAANTVLCLFLLVFWNSMPQQLNNALVPIVCILGFRSYTIAKPLFIRSAR